MNDSDTNIIKPGQGYLDLPVSKFVLWTLPFWKSLNCTPNTLTTLGLICSILCIYFLYKRNVILSIIFLLLRVYFDYADGLYARKYKQFSVFGDWYDHITDWIFAIGFLSAFIFSKYSKKNKHLQYWFIGILVSFFLLNTVQNSCVEKEYKKHKKDKTSISELSGMCPLSLKPVLDIFDTASMYVCMIIIIVLFCKYK